MSIIFLTCRKNLRFLFPIKYTSHPYGLIRKKIFYIEEIKMIIAFKAYYGFI